MTYDDYVKTSVPQIPLPIPLPSTAPEGFCSICGRVAKFWDDAYGNLTYSACCHGEPVRLKLVR